MANDYNPDRERHRDHKWIIHKANTQPDFNGVYAGDKNMPFNHEGRFSIKDEGVAQEIRQEYGRAVTVTRVNNTSAADRGHRYFFSTPALPWHKYDEQGRRIK